VPNKSVIFIEPAGSKANVFDNFMKLPLLGSLYLGTILHNAGYIVKIINENILGRKISPFELNADYLCISCLTLTSNRAKELIIKAREIFPDIKIIVGGIHPSLLPIEFADLVDYVVVGEAETIIIDIIEGKRSGTFSEILFEPKLIVRRSCGAYLKKGNMSSGGLI